MFIVHVYEFDTQHLHHSSLNERLWFWRLELQPRSQGSLLPALRNERWPRVSQNLGDYKQTI